MTGSFAPNGKPSDIMHFSLASTPYIYIVMANVYSLI